MYSIIFHLPWTLTSISSASQLRPRKMIEAFLELGFEVDVVSGDRKTRAFQVDSIKTQLKNGKKYLFCYSESSVLPTLFASGKKGFLKYPLPDYKLFFLLLKHGIPTGLFLRDVYWLAPNYKEINPNTIRRLFFRLAFYLDLLVYSRILSVLFLPSMLVMDLLPKYFTNLTVLPLPPATWRINNSSNLDQIHVSKNLVYVGGIGSHYEMIKAFEVAACQNKWTFTFCVRETDWNKVSSRYAQYISPSVVIKNAHSEQLEDLYKNSSIASLFVEPSFYWHFAMPYKLFEYLGWGLPIIAIKGTASGEFVAENDVGWSISYNNSALIELLQYLHDNPDEIRTKSKNALGVACENTWQRRAMYVQEQLTSF